MSRRPKTPLDSVEHHLPSRLCTVVGKNRSVWAVAGVGGLLRRAVPSDLRVQVLIVYGAPFAKTGARLAGAGRAASRTPGWRRPLVGCQNSVRRPRNQRFAGRTLILAPHTGRGKRPRRSARRPGPANKAYDSPYYPVEVRQISRTKTLPENLAPPENARASP